MSEDDPPPPPEHLPVDAPEGATGNEAPQDSPAAAVTELLATSLNSTHLQPSTSQHALAILYTLGSQPVHRTASSHRPQPPPYTSSTRPERHSHPVPAHPSTNPTLTTVYLPQGQPQKVSDLPLIRPLPAKLSHQPPPLS
ncbi:hypothetical protein IAT38_004284 [Cryptococcus sp. DSM 104549]